MSHGNEHDNESHGHDEPVIPVGAIIPQTSFQDKLLTALALVALAGLLYYGWLFSQTPTLPVAVEHGQSSE